MFTALSLLLLGTAAFVVVGAVVAIAGIRNAPEGYETAEGFQFGRACNEPLPTQESWREHGARLVARSQVDANVQGQVKVRDLDVAA